jgi:hypothetical protein
MFLRSRNVTVTFMIRIIKGSLNRQKPRLWSPVFFSWIEPTWPPYSFEYAGIFDNKAYSAMALCSGWCSIDLRECAKPLVVQFTHVYIICQTIYLGDAAGFFKNCMCFALWRVSRDQTVRCGPYQITEPDSGLWPISWYQTFTAAHSSKPDPALWPIPEEFVRKSTLYSLPQTWNSLGDIEF